MGEKVASLWVELGLDSASLIAGFNRAKDSLAKFTDKVRTVTSGAQDITAAFFMIKGAVNSIVSPFQDAMAAYVGLAAEVRALSRATGVSNEEASKMIETMGDLKIPTESLTMAMRTMIQNGVNPTVENLARMADEYLALPPGVDRAAYALKNFGARGGLEMAKALELGGDELRRMNDSVQDSKILNEQAVTAARAYEIAQEELTDVTEGLQIQMGKFLIPIVVTLTQDILNLGKSEKQLAQEARNTTKEIRDQSTSLGEYRARIFALVPGLDKVIKSTSMWGRTAAGVAAEGLTKLVGASSDFTFGLTKLQDKEETIKEKMLDAAAANREMIDGFTRAPAKIALTEEALKELADEGLAKVNEQLTALGVAMGGDLGDENRDYGKSVGELNDRVKELRDGIAELEGKKWLSPEQKTDLENYYKELDGIGGQYSDLADEHEKATKRILFGFLQQQMAADGLSQKEADVLAAVAADWGLIDQATKTAWDSMGKYTDDIDASVQSAEDIAAAITGIPKDTTINVTEKRKIEYTNLGAPGSPTVAPSGRPVTVNMTVTENLNVLNVAKQVVKLIKQQAV